MAQRRGTPEHHRPGGHPTKPTFPARLAVRPIALRMVWQASRAVRIPICGMGGITSAADAVKFLLCGATAVQVGTQNYLEPGIAGEVADGLVAYAERHGVARLADLTGALEVPASRR